VKVFSQHHDIFNNAEFLKSSIWSKKITEEKNKNCKNKLENTDIFGLH